MNTIIQWLFGSGTGELAGGTDWRIAFVSDYNNYVKFALLLVFAAMIYLTIRSYMREGDAKRSTKLLLAGIRIAVILLAFMVIFRPAVVLRFTKTLYSNVLVLIDSTSSQKFKDRYNDPKASKKMADALHVGAGELRELSRTDIVRKMLPPVLEDLTKDHPVELWCFGTNKDPDAMRLGPAIEDGIKTDKAAAKPQPSSAPANIQKMLFELKGDGYETDIPGALRSAIDGLQGKRASIVLVSDGRNTTSGTDNRLSAVRDYAAQRGLTIYTVTVGDPEAPKSIGVIGLQAPREARLGSEVLFVAKLSYRGMVGQSLTVKLERRKPDEKDWKEVTKADNVKLEGFEGDKTEASHGDQQVELRTTLGTDPSEQGDYIYRAVVDYPAEALVSPPAFAEAPVKISNKQIRVLLVSADAGHEFQYLKTYLLSQPEVYKISVWQQDADIEVNQASSTGMKLTAFPNSLKAIIGEDRKADDDDKKSPGYDAVILYDPEPTAGGFDKNFADNLKTAVDRHGIGLCYIVGNKYSALTLGNKYKMGDDEDAFKSLRDLIPVQLSGHDIPDMVTDKKPDPHQVRITAYGLDHPVMRLGTSDEDTQKLWESMPGIFWSHPLMRIKPTARVLAENSDDLRRIDRNIAEPIAAAMPVGRGRVLYMNSDETWRWRFFKDAEYYRDFWANVVKYLTPTSARQVIISAGGDRFAAGSEIKVEVEAYDDEYKELKADSYTITMIDKTTGEKTDIKCEPVADKPGRFKATIPPKMTAHVGTFALTNLSMDPQKIEPKEFKIELPQAEAARPESDPVTMENIATKNEFAVDIADVAQLNKLIPQGRLPSVHEDPHEMWDTNLTIVLIVVLLTIEWILRKKYNMA